MKVVRHVAVALVSLVITKAGAVMISIVETSYLPLNSATR